MHKHIANYRFDLVANTIYDFVWNNYCDWYLEFAKVSLKDESLSEKQKNGVKYTLAKVLENILALAHPLIPFITESIYQQLKTHLENAQTSIMDVAYPQFDKKFQDSKSTDSIIWLQTVTNAIRNMRSEVGIKPSLEVDLIIKELDSKSEELLNTTQIFIKALARIKDISINATPPTSLSQIAEGIELNIPLEGLVDIDAELARLEKELDKLAKEVERVEKKLSNERFVSSAPQSVVAAEKDKLAKYKDLYAKTFEKKNSLGK